MTDYPVLKMKMKKDSDLIDPARLGKCTIGVEPGTPKEEGGLGWFDEDLVLEVRCGGMFVNKAFFLDDEEFDWVLGMDDEAHLVLVPLKKEV